ncbi:MAG: hypothetical protein HRU28_03990 [Rhizobiales bacterium]|nr:hypothetical protein [Hyphomicrobiales bacterium]
MNRLRDERGLYTDVFANGLARRAILEAGSRLAQRGLLKSRETLLYASVEEMVMLLDTGDAEKVDITEIERRQEFCDTHSLEDAPLTIGDASHYDVPSIDDIPTSDAFLPLRALSVIMNEIYENDEDDEHSDESNQLAKIQGQPVNSGVYEGVARVINSVDDFSRICQGDILVARSTTASYNVILPLLGAIVTDRGGQLSHAAIVAREFGMPAVVGTREATRLIKDGDKIVVNGDNGTVMIIK